MSGSRYFDVQRDGPVAVVKFKEKLLNDLNVQQISEELAVFTSGLGRGELHLDFNDVTYPSTAVMAKLLGLHKRVTAEGGRFVLKNLHDLYELFSVTHLDAHFQLHRTDVTTDPQHAM